MSFPAGVALSGATWWSGGVLKKDHVLERDRSLIMGRATKRDGIGGGGVYKTGGGQVKFHPYERGTVRTEKKLKGRGGGQTEFRGSFYTVLAILKGGVQTVPTL